MNGRVLSDIEREYEGGNEGPFPEHKSGQALYVGTAFSANTGRLPSVVLMLG